MLNVQLWVSRVKCCFSSFFLFDFRQNPKARASSIITNHLVTIMPDHSGAHIVSSRIAAQAPSYYADLTFVRDPSFLADDTYFLADDRSASLLDKRIGVGSGIRRRTRSGLPVNPKMRLKELLCLSQEWRQRAGAEPLDSQWASDAGLRCAMIMADGSRCPNTSRSIITIESAFSTSTEMMGMSGMIFDGEDDELHHKGAALGKVSRPCVVGQRPL